MSEIFVEPSKFNTTQLNSSSFSILRQREIPDEAVSTPDGEQYLKDKGVNDAEEFAIREAKRRNPTGYEVGRSDHIVEQTLNDSRLNHWLRLLTQPTRTSLRGIRPFRMPMEARVTRDFCDFKEFVAWVGKCINGTDEEHFFPGELGLVRKTNRKAYQAVRKLSTRRTELKGSEEHQLIDRLSEAFSSNGLRLEVPLFSGPNTQTLRFIKGSPPMGLLRDSFFEITQSQRDAFGRGDFEQKFEKELLDKVNTLIKDMFKITENFFSEYNFVYDQQRNHVKGRPYIFKNGDTCVAVIFDLYDSGEHQGPEDGGIDRPPEFRNALLNMSAEEVQKIIAENKEDKAVEILIDNIIFIDPVSVYQCKAFEA